MFKGGISDQARTRARREAEAGDLAPVYRLAYVSRASSLFQPEDLQKINEQSSLRNAEADITGILIVDSGKIMQILEGREDRVRALFERIAQDPRHESVKQVAGNERSQRLLHCWSMVGLQTGLVSGEVMERYHDFHDHLSGVAERVEIAVEQVD